MKTLEEQFTEWFQESGVDFWREANAPCELANIAAGTHRIAGPFSEGQAQERRVVQITGNDRINALCDDGTVWSLGMGTNPKWTIEPLIPQPEPQQPASCVKPFSTYPKDRDRLLALSAEAQHSDDAAAIELAELVSAILDDEKYVEPQHPAAQPADLVAELRDFRDRLAQDVSSPSIREHVDTFDAILSRAGWRDAL